MGSVKALLLRVGIDKGCGGALAPIFAVGLLDIYIQNASHGPDKESNWLPAPLGGFNLILRDYWPQESVLNGSSVPPGVQQVGN